MLKSLKIRNFRCFEEFDLPQLGRINLLVGKNNGGKTSILEAVHILNSPDSIKSFLDIIESRGEYFQSSNDNYRFGFEANHFLHGHSSAGDNFNVSGMSDEARYNMFSFLLTSASIRELELAAKRENRSFENAGISLQTVELNYTMRWDIGSHKSLLCLPSNMSISQVTAKNIPSKISRFVPVNFSDVYTIIEDFNQIVLTPQEETLYEALRIIEPGIERIAPVTTQGYGSAGFVVSINKQRVPIGSMGYGIWRILEITLAMVNIPGGTLLIDEIDTGLHFSVMIDLWKLICKTAEKLDIQVFATTHNSDCWKSLAEVANSDDIASDDITIHRIERDKKASIVFNEQEMAIAAERDIEVR